MGPLFQWRSYSFEEFALRHFFVPRIRHFASIFHFNRLCCFVVQINCRVRYSKQGENDDGEFLINLDYFSFKLLPRKAQTIYLPNDCPLNGLYCLPYSIPLVSPLWLVMQRKWTNKEKEMAKWRVNRIEIWPHFIGAIIKTDYDTATNACSYHRK